MKPYSVSPGSPEPLGASLQVDGVNVAVISSAADAIFFCLFDDDGREIQRIKLIGRTGDVFHAHVGGVGAGARYGLRAEGPFDLSKGLRFNPAKLLVDPYAIELDRPFKLHPSLFDARIHGAPEDLTDSAAFVPKAIVTPAPALAAPRRPSTPWRDLIIYEMHVRGFTRNHPGIPQEIRGTFAGLAHPAAIAHLTRLGVTAVELLPIQGWLDERHLPALGLANYWGYNPVAFNAPDPRLAPGGWPEVRAAVEALQADGISVILDVVLNHSGESDHLGPTVSLRGLDNGLYYRLDPQNATLYENQAGCGNVLALERPHALRLALDALRTAAIRAGVDGFRYDLAPVLARGPQGFDPSHPFLAAVAQDPTLRELIHIAEPWDLGLGGYQLGAFPASWGEWNDKSRDAMRRFWRGDHGQLGAMATRFAGSADIFAGRRRALSRSINFITAHDGFTLADLVAFSQKHNEANGENNRDGTDDNLSWNCGAEGETSDPAMIQRRRGDVRALLATLIASRGSPMLTMGDELGRTQKGNNNAYAQDNELAYVDWANADEELIDFCARLIKLRRETGALSGETPLTGAPPDASGAPDVEWLGLSGEPLTPQQWEEASADALVAVFYDPGDARLAPSRAAVLINRGYALLHARLPGARESHIWTQKINSAEPRATGAEAPDGAVSLPPRSVVILTETAAASARPRAGVDERVLDALAAAAGIAPYWHDIEGRRTDVSVETKLALLRSLELAAANTGEARARLAELSEERAFRPLPVATSLVQHGERTIRLGGALAERQLPFALTIACDDGSTHIVEISPEIGRRGEILAPDGRRALTREIPLPDLPLGRHEVMSEAAPDCHGHLAIVPFAAFLPQALREGRVFGVAAQAYGLRRQSGGGDQGIGDFTCLRILAEEAARAGAACVGVNPLHALYPHDPERASPYHPSDRRFLDPLAIDVFDLPSELMSEAVMAALSRAAPEAAALSAAGFVDYRAVFALKDRLFDVIHAAFRARRLAAPDDALVMEFERFLVLGGESLRRFAIFTAIERALGATLGQFGPELNAPHAPGIEAFAAQHDDEVKRAKFLQFLADRQFAAAAQAAKTAGLSLGFYRDLAVGCAPDGAEAFSDMSRLMQGVSIGAPPDPLGPKGQVWGLPPPDPRALARDGYKGFGRLIAANMAYAGILRIDHVLGLKRLFLVPEGAEGKDGAYLACPFEALIGQVALESQRAQTAVVGEDLGTAPSGLRDELARANILSYRVMRFEREGREFLPPESYPALAAACVATHDLPPLAGWWSGADLGEAAALGHIADEQAAARDRAEEKAELLAAVACTDFSGDGVDYNAPLTEAAAAAIHGFVARSGAALVLIQADDLAMEVVPTNLPGTDRERPNWRRKISEPVERLFALHSAQTILETVRRWRGS
ncbi:glycogen debranching enzyme GlgX [Methylocella silvestris BL2]|uniref:4-alpha-glucanotransferase n=1 Tax=Methylocella silvestris (strain DSM 15510 / CIP 108128 / LMG 27833 / NCIMB 13906 / BL2) TaxID=395965 RepID=B8EN57_METSB|nr:bifunctional glycogen debranching protein GlgX/4-alpha-glucanotransferase [Methylocella silvestris]ACK49192.1 glycogen debranching enzyme GlgX [Methylocella silvestris BL2]